MSFVFSTRRPKRSKKSAGIAAIAALVAASSGVFSNFAATRGRKLHGGDIGSMTTLLIFCAAIAVPIVIFLVVRLTRNGDDDDCRTGDMNTSERDDTRDDEDGNGLPRALVFAAAVAAIAIAMLVVFYAQPVRAQGAADRGALFIRAGADTVVRDRFSRTGDTLMGSMQTKAQRVDYVAVLGPGDDIRTLTYDVYAPTAKDGDAPAVHVRFVMRGDTAIAETPSGPQRVATKPGAIPMMNNMLALTELFTRRAKAAGGTLEIPYLVTAGGATIIVSVKPAGTDSLSMTIAGQEQRFHVDAAGRILGGTVVGRNLEFLRGGAESAGTFHAAPAAPPAPPPDYSAPPGAPYSAENVHVTGPAGTLGGTLTKPKGARGPLPAVVTITGSGLQDRDELIPFAGGVRLFRELADTLGRRGIAVLRLDDRGLGESTGDASKATTADFADDIRAGVAYLRSRADIDPNRIALVGHSEGGTIGPMIASTDPKIRAVVTLGGPAWKGIDISMGQNKYTLDRDKSLTQVKRDSILREARTQLDRQTMPWLKFFFAYDPAPMLRQVKQPTLVVQGATDQQIVASQADSLAKLIRAGGNTDVTVRVFPATDHLFVADSSGDPAKYNDLKSNKVRSEVLGAIADWLVLKLGAKSAM